MTKKILLIEDNLEMRENTAEILELAHYDVQTAENGKVGVALAKKVKPDLIICDVMMPELDGYGALYLLSKDPETSGIPFIFLTAKAEKSDFRKGMNLGADDYLTKPFEEMELLNAIESRMKRSEIFKKDFKGDATELTNFIDNARGLEELKKLSTDKKSRVYKKKEILFHEGDSPNYLLFIKSGKVKSFKMNEEGKEYITELNKAGEFLGYTALLENTACNDTATALEDSEIMLIPKDDFLNLVYSNRDVSSQFMKMLSNNIAEKEEKLLNLAYNSVRKRVAEALCLLEKRYKDKDDAKFSMAITREDLANIVGTATETVIRTLSDFKEEKLIEIKGRNITIVAPEKLANLKY